MIFKNLFLKKVSVSVLMTPVALKGIETPIFDVFEAKQFLEIRGELFFAFAPGG